MSSQDKFDEVDAYLAERLLPEDETLNITLNRQTEAGLPPMAVSSLQGAFLNIIAQSLSAKRILELGTFAGYSTIWLARALPEGGKLITLELQDVNADLAQRNFDDAGLSDRTEIRRGPAEKSMNIMINDGVPPFDLIFMDCHMPEMSGFEATERIRQLSDERSRLPIVAMTANALEGDRDRCIAAGMDGYIDKPISADDLQAALAKWTRAVH